MCCLHSVKGLEFENVFIMGLNHGTFPSAKATIAVNPLCDTLSEERTYKVCCRRSC
ncbi:MAG: hypothetical protein LBN01_00805 [Endomicrobium sp.]|nr:hypothetical protein [Endomicrobium sp.]